MTTNVDYMFEDMYVSVILVYFVSNLVEGLNNFVGKFLILRENFSLLNNFSIFEKTYFNNFDH